MTGGRQKAGWRRAARNAASAALASIRGVVPFCPAGDIIVDATSEENEQHSMREGRVP